jgi:23S rRNA (uridine2552-2'-O)-methyltransferase
MKRSKSSRRWLDRHVSDPYVQRAQRDGWRSRAAFKLLELDRKDRLLRPGLLVVDLGAAPGGWSQVAARAVGPKGRVVALDLLPMEPIIGVDFIQGDFREEAVLQRLLAVLDGQPPDLVLSDMAPNVSGMLAVDQPRAIYLCELALELADRVLRDGGMLAMKAFHGEGFDSLLRDARSRCERLVTRKPESSRAKSREVYLVGSGFRRPDADKSH